MDTKQNFQWQSMTMGTCYYPEHWNSNLWEQDLRRMKKVGISVIRIAEFAWNKFEPSEGEFTFDFFDSFLKLCQQEDMQVIVGTPSATPPAWLTEKYPEVLNRNKDGVPYFHGGRRHYNYNAPIYQELVSRIVTKMAVHYGRHPSVVGWQIDNELNCETDEFYSEADSRSFRSFLKKKYDTLENLNQSLGTVFWNQTYTDWTQLYVPRPTLNNGLNPHLQLEYFRFISESAINFCMMQANIIRKYKKESDFITTNGLFGNIDNHLMEKKAIDVYTYDSYPNFAFGLGKEQKVVDNLNDRHWSKNLIDVRSICPHFGIMEQQSGANGWTNRMECPAPRPGQLTLWAMQSVAHGADFISFFRWRTSCIGTEIYWHGILDYDSRDNRKLAEVKAFSEKFKSMNALCGSEYTASFALMKDYDNVWDSQVDVWHKRVQSYSEEEIFIASELNHTPYDTVFLQNDSDLASLQKYPVIFYPHPVLINEPRVTLLKNYVEQGGILILGCRSGYKDMNGKCVMMPQPGLLAELTGSDVIDFTFCSPAEEMVFAEWKGKKIEAPIFNDVLKPIGGAKVLANYGNSYYQGEAALTENSIGKGKVLHFGSTFTRENMKQFLSYSGILRPFIDFVDAPETVELVMRNKNKKNYLFVLNYQPVEVTFEIKREMLDFFTRKQSKGRSTLPPFGTAIYEVVS